MTNCFLNISASIQRSCSNPLVKGNTGRALLIDKGDIEAITISDGKISAITLAAAAQAVAIENFITTPFDGTNSASTDEDGYKVHTKTFAFRVPERGAEVSEKIIDPMVNSANGYLAIVEKIDAVGDGSFEVLGYEAGLKVNGDGVTQSETENGGAIMVTMSGQQTHYSYTLVGATPNVGETVYGNAKAVFDTLYSGAYNVVY